MKKIVSLLAGLVLAAAITSCASTVPVAGATGKVGAKVGQASTTSFLGFPFSGDAGIVAAAKNGGITNVGTVDMKTSFGFLSVTLTTIVTGE